MYKITINLIIMAVLSGSMTCAQTIAVSADDPRPVSALAYRLEQLSGIPVNYEDIRYDNPSDIKDVTDSVRRSQAGTGVRVLVPLGGRLSVNIVVDPVTQRLTDRLSVATALNAVLAAANGSATLPGRFKSESYDDGLYIIPTQARSSNGSFAPVESVLSRPVNLKGEQLTAWETFIAILQQVSQRAGFKVDVGTVPIKTFAVAKVALSASNEPANRVLSRLFAEVCARGRAPGQAVAKMSYSMLFDPRQRYYAVNVHFVPDPNAKEPPVENGKKPTVQDPSRFYRKGSQ